MWFSEPCLSSWCWQTRFRCVHDNRGISRVPRWELQTVTPGCTSRKQDTGTFTGFWMDHVDYVKLLLQRVWRFYQGDGTRPHLRRVWKTSSRSEVQRAAAAGGRRSTIDTRWKLELLLTLIHGDFSVNSLWLMLLRRHVIWSGGQITQNTHTKGPTTVFSPTVCPWNLNKRAAECDLSSRDKGWG